MGQPGKKGGGERRLAGGKIVWPVSPDGGIRGEQIAILSKRVWGLVGRERG